MYHEQLETVSIGWGDDCECDQCGKPLSSGDEALCDRRDGFTFCGAGCASAFAVDQDHGNGGTVATTPAADYLD